jgi:hypothetical protein
MPQELQLQGLFKEEGRRSIVIRETCSSISLSLFLWRKKLSGDFASLPWTWINVME